MNDDERDNGGFMLGGIRELIQAVCVLAIALGAGLFGFGSYMRPDVEVNMNGPAAFVEQRQISESDWEIAAICTGTGIGFITLGGLGLVVPWVNVVMSRGRYASEPAPVSEPRGASA